MIVVDASALSAFILREEGWEELARYLVRSLSVDHVVEEVANTIWKASCVRKVLTVNEALKAFKILLMMVGKNLVLHSELKYLSMAMNISLKHSITIYDSLYIAQAIMENTSLLTLDEKQRRVAKALGVNTLP